MEGLLDVQLEGDQAGDDESVLLELLSMLEARLQELEEAVASEQQRHHQVNRERWLLTSRCVCISTFVRSLQQNVMPSACKVSLTALTQTMSE